MSYTTIYRVPEKGEIQIHSEFRNAFRGAYLVWDNFAKRYLNRNASAMIVAQQMQPVWDLWEDEKLPVEHQIVMMSTFDKVMVKRENLPRLIAAFERYCKDFADPGHIPEQITALQELVDEESCFAVCWRQTSVACCWSHGHRNYDISKDSDHYFLFDRIGGGVR